MTRAKRREATGGELEEMSDDELAEIWTFGDLVGRLGKALFTASPEDQLRAGEILESRAARLN